MKVGTDGVLLGAWATAVDGRPILDAGCGTGLIGLMMAQRFPLSPVTGVELEKEAALQATENVAASPFACRMSVVCADVRQFRGQFDAIVCNPPFFSEKTASPHALRALARSEQSLSFPQLWESVNRLLVPGGYFNVIIPCAEKIRFQQLAIAAGFTLHRSCLVSATVRKEPKRIMLCYVKGNCDASAPGHMVLQDDSGKRSEALKSLTDEFYLW